MTTPKNSCICLVILLVLLLILTIIGLYFTFTKEKRMVLESCYNLGGSCREHNHCEETYQSRVITRCILRRKVCCLQTKQMLKLLEKR